MKKILITGANGNIGSELQKKLQGDITLLDMDVIDYNTDHNQFILNLANKEKTLIFFKENNFDIVIHLAAISRVEDAQKNPEIALKYNVKATENILNSILETNQKPHFIFSSSREVYGDLKTEYCFYENSKCNPQNIYGKSKLNAEIIIEKHKNKFPITILRLANVYGGVKDNKNRFIPQLLNSINENSHFKLNGQGKHLDFVHIDDVIEIISKFSTTETNDNHFSIYNIASGKTQCLDSIIRKFINNDLCIITNPKNYEVQNTAINNNKICDLFNYSFKSFESELEKLINSKKIKQTLNGEIV